MSLASAAVSSQLAFALAVSPSAASGNMEAGVSRRHLSPFHLRCAQSTGWHWGSTCGHPDIEESKQKACEGLALGILGCVRMLRCARGRAGLAAGDQGLPEAHGEGRLARRERRRQRQVRRLLHPGAGAALWAMRMRPPAAARAFCEQAPCYCAFLNKSVWVSLSPSQGATDAARNWSFGKTHMAQM